MVKTKEMTNMKYEGKTIRKSVGGSAEILVKMSPKDSTSSILERMEMILGAFYKKTVEWKRDNPHTEIRIQPATRMYPMMLADMPICSKQSTSFIVSSRMDPFSPVSMKVWRDNFEATVHALAGAFDQQTVCVEYTNINVVVFEKATEGDE